jgi:hypothetical protein
MRTCRLKNPQISVIIPTLNEERYIRNLLISLKNQSFKNFEVIIVDGGSSDKTVQVAEAFGARIIVKPKLKEFPSRNEGAKVASGEILLFTGADIIMLPKALEMILTEFEQNKLDGLCAFGRIYDAPLWGKIEYYFYYSLLRLKIIFTKDYQPLKPISVYGAVKLACETLIGTYARLYGLKALILRYANVVGPRMRHGVLVDFLGKLRACPWRLEILGDGYQRKSYIYVEDALEATLKALDRLLRSGEPMGVFNVGSEDWVSVREIADMVVESMGLKGVEYVYKPATDDGKGWVGDVKTMLLDVRKLKALGWVPKLGSREAIWKTLKTITY